MSGRMNNRGVAQESSSDALAAAAAIGNALSNNGRTVDKSKIPQYNQNFTSRTTSIAGIKRYTMSSYSKTYSRASSMSGNVNRSSVRTSSLPNKAHSSTANNSKARRQHRAHEDAETTFREFGGRQSSKVLNVPTPINRQNKSKSITHKSPGSMTATIKKYIPGPRGLVAVEVPVQERFPGYDTSPHIRNVTARTYSLPTENHYTNLIHRKKTTQTTASRGRKSENEFKSKGDRSKQKLPEMLTKLPKKQHNENISLIQTTMNEETEQELKDDEHDPFEFKPMTISDDNNSFIASNSFDRKASDKTRNCFEGREKKEEIERLLNDVHNLEAKISDIEIAKSHEEEREQNLILELRKVKLNGERRMEILKRELSIAKENADLEAEELKLIAIKGQEQVNNGKEIKSKIESVAVYQPAIPDPQKLLLEDREDRSNTQDQSQDIGNSESNYSILDTADKNPINPIILDSFNEPALHTNSGNESKGDEDSESFSDSQLSDYNYIEGSAADLRATAKTSVGSEIDSDQIGQKLSQQKDLEEQDEGKQEHNANSSNTNCVWFKNKKSVVQEGLDFSTADVGSPKTLLDTSEIDCIKSESGSDYNGNKNDDDIYSDEDEDDGDEEYHDSYDVIVHEPTLIEHTISCVPSLEYPSEYPNETQNGNNNEQNYNATEVSHSEVNMAKYLRDANPYIPCMSSNTLNVDPENVNSRSSTETTKTIHSLLKGSPQPAFKSVLLNKKLAVPSSNSSSIYSMDTPPNSNANIPQLIASNTRTNSISPSMHSSEQKRNNPGFMEIPAMSPRRLEDKRKMPDRMCVRTLRGSSNGPPLCHNISQSSSTSSSSPSYHSTKSPAPLTSKGQISQKVSKSYAKTFQMEKPSTKLPTHVPSNIDEKNRILYPKEPPAKKSSFEKERPASHNLGFKSMSLREPFVTKNQPITRAGSLINEERKERKGHVSRNSWTFSLPSPLKAKANHFTHSSNEVEKIVGSMNDSRNKVIDNGEPTSVNKKDYDYEIPSMLTASSMNNNENISEAGTEGHRFSLLKNKSQSSNRNVSAGTTALNSTNSELSIALPLSVPVTVIEKNGEIHKLYNDDAAMKDKSHNHHGSHNKFGRKLRKFFGRK